MFTFHHERRFGFAPFAFAFPLFLFAGFASANDAESGAKASANRPIFEAMSPGGYEAIRVPDWVYDTTRMGFLTWRQPSPEAMRDAYDRGIRVLHMSTVALDDPATLAEAKRLGLRTVFGWGMWPFEILKDHPEWRYQPKEIKGDDKFDTSTEACILSPWADYAADYWAEQFRTKPIDGLCFDGPRMWGLCHCPACTSRYRADTGKAIPLVENLADPEFKAFYQWQMKAVDDFVRNLQKKIKAANPDAVMMNWAYNCGRLWYMQWLPSRIALPTDRLFDMPMMEWWHDDTVMGASIMPEFAAAHMRAIAGARPSSVEPYPSLHCDDWIGPLGYAFPRVEEKFRILQGMTYGTLPSYGPFCPEPDRVNMVMDEIKSREKWLTRTKSVRYAALLQSDHTRTFYGQTTAEVTDRVLAHMFGFFETAIEEHLPLDIITDLEIEEDQLEGYKVLILPNAACLTARQCEVIRRFVENGGGVVATMYTSAYDEQGNPRDNFALADLFGADLAAKPPLPETKPQAFYQAWIDLAMATRDPRLAEYAKTMEEGKRALGSLKGNALAIKPRAGAQVWGNIQLMKEKETAPFGIANTAGKGHVYYLGASFDKAYFTYPSPYQRIMLKEAILAAAGAPPAFTVTAPLSVRTTFFTQTDAKGSRLVIHVLNTTNSSNMAGDPKGAVSCREEIMPVHDVKIAIKGYDIKRIHIEPGNQKARSRKTDEGVEVPLPQVDLHSMIVAELK